MSYRPATASRRRDGSIVVATMQGAPLFTVPTPVAYRTGASPAQGHALATSLTGAGTSWTLTVDTSPRWLREELAAGAVAVDPSVTVSGTQACTLNAEFPKVAACSSATLQSGYDSTHQEHHGLLQFDLSSLPQGADVMNAKLGLYVEAKSTSNAKAVGVYRVTKPWTTAATWETYDGTHAWAAAGGDYEDPATNSDASVNPSVGAATGWSYWYPTKMVQEWANAAGGAAVEGYDNYGLVIKDQTDNVTSNLLTLASPSAASNKPYIEVEYIRRGQGVSSQYTQLSSALTDKLTMSVNPASGNLMLANQDMHIAGIAGNDFNSTRTFNSLNQDQQDLGRWNESMFLESHEEPNGDIHVDNGTGELFLFAKQSNGTFITPPGIKATLCVTSTAPPCPSSLPSGVARRLVYEDPAGHYVDFSTLNHWAYHFGDRNGNMLTAGYTEGTDAITSWTDTRGRTIKYKVAPSSFYTEMSDVSGGRHTSYGYNEEVFPNLTSYTDANGNTTKYEYSGGNLTKLTTPKGNVIKFVYDSKHRVTEVIRTNSEHVTGPTTKYVYYEIGSAPSPCTASQRGTRVEDPEWKSTVAEAHETLYCANVIDEVEQTIDAKKHETKATFDPFGNQLSTTAPERETGAGVGVSSLVYGTGGINLECQVQGTATPSSTCPGAAMEKGYASEYAHKDGTFPAQTTEATSARRETTKFCYWGGETACATSEGTSESKGTLRQQHTPLASENNLNYNYNKNGTVSSSTDGDLHETTYKYDGSGNLEGIVPPTGSGLGKTTIAVDAVSRPHTITQCLAESKGTCTSEPDNNPDLRQPRPRHRSRRHRPGSHQDVQIFL